MAFKTGKELVVGDVLDLWYKRNAMILKIEPMKQNKMLDEAFPKGYFSITTTSNTPNGWLSMTVGNDDEFNTVKIV